MIYLRITGRLISISVTTTRNFARTITSEQNGSTTANNTGPEGNPEAGGGVNINSLQSQNLSQSSSSTTDSPPPPNNHQLEGQKQQQQQAFTRSREYENFKQFRTVPPPLYNPTPSQTNTQNFPQKTPPEDSVPTPAVSTDHTSPQTTPQAHET